MPNQYDMSWGEISDAKTTDYIKIENNRQGTRIRLAGAPSQLFTHWEKDIDDKTHKIICPGASCPLCEAGVKTSVRFQCLAIDKTAANYSDAEGYLNGGPKVKVLEVGTSVVRAIKDLANEPMYGNPMGYDIIIKKEGAGRDTKYSVIPTPYKSDLTEDEKTAIAGATPIREMSKAKTAEEIIEMKLAALAGPGDEPSAPTGAAAGAQQGAGAKDNDWELFK